MQIEKNEKKSKGSRPKKYLQILAGRTKVEATYILLICR